ncbi:MAG: hypothetical protein EPO51_20030 [Phenylobacterium sp.]|uniref:hypothetical protein n=1 Tax=Phenylobacterium sp. TaxID=1871053 RepID=UPI0012209E71|nr:hypothetical protein [Phenylobacterium sp.]TAJ69820.1 MAG: hypothetical protein EPO51_20030 [Phenylobacterium sp.]
MLTSSAFTSNPAVVARTDQGSDAESYLLVMPAGRAIWVGDPEAATAFTSMREATRMATRLPACQRAYGLPREAELSVHRAH